MKKTRLVSAKEITTKALENKYAVGQFNINNLEWTIAVLNALVEQNAPGILGVSEGAAKYMGGFSAIAGMLNGLMEDMDIKVPVVLHLDHGSSVENCKKALDAGFTSVMFDGSELPIEENVNSTKQVVEYAKQYNASVEGEVGTVGGEEDGVVGGISYASLDQVEKLAATGVDMIAASLGSVHGHYAGEPKLGFKEMKEYSSTINKPLVLHGGSGIPDDMIKMAVESGEGKININTELQEVNAAAVKKYFTDGNDLKAKGYDPRKIYAPGKVAITKEVVTKIKLFGSNNKA